MTADHSSYEELASARRGTPDYREGYAEAQRAYLIGQAVRDRRLGPRALPGRASLPRRHDPTGPLPPGSRRRHPHHPPARTDLRRPRRRPHRPDRTTRCLTTGAPARQDARTCRCAHLAATRPSPARHRSGQRACWLPLSCGDISPKRTHQPQLSAWDQMCQIRTDLSELDSKWCTRLDGCCQTGRARGSGRMRQP
jgi:hypothetical protein